MHPDGPGALTAARSPVKVRPVGSDPAFIRPAHVRWLSVNPFSSDKRLKRDKLTHELKLIRGEPCKNETFWAYSDPWRIFSTSSRRL